jgi:hypothetical protein
MSPLAYFILPSFVPEDVLSKSCTPGALDALFNHEFPLWWSRSRLFRVMLRRLRCLCRSKSASSSSSHIHFPPAWLYSRLTCLLRLFIKSKCCLPVLTSRSFYVYQITLNFLDSDHDHAQCRAPGALIQRLIPLLLACFTYHTHRTFLVLRDILRMITLFISHTLYLHVSFSCLAFAGLLHILTSIFRAPRDTRTAFDLG